MRPIVRASIVGVALAALTLVLLVLGARRSFDQICEVCVAFEGRTACREASGGTVEEASRTAKDNACAFLASGMTKSIQCLNTRPTGSTCRPSR